MLGTFFHMFSSARPHSAFFNTLVYHPVCFTNGSGVGRFTLPCTVVPQVPNIVYKELRKQGGGGQGGFVNFPGDPGQKWPRISKIW